MPIGRQEERALREAAPQAAQQGRDPEQLRGPPPCGPTTLSRSGRSPLGVQPCERETQASG